MGGSGSCPSDGVGHHCSSYCPGSDWEIQHKEMMVSIGFYVCVIPYVCYCVGCSIDHETDTCIYVASACASFIFALVVMRTALIDYHSTHTQEDGAAFERVARTERERSPERDGGWGAAETVRGTEGRATVHETSEVLSLGADLHTCPSLSFFSSLVARSRAVGRGKPCPDAQH